MTAPRRRWSFGLRTLLLVVAILAVPLAWVGYSLNWIRERRQYLQQGISRDACSPTLTAPAGLWVFGEKAYGGVVAVWGANEDPEDVKERVDGIQRLFPEAQVHIMGVAKWPRPLPATKTVSPGLASDPTPAN